MPLDIGGFHHIGRAEQLVDAIQVALDDRAPGLSAERVAVGIEAKLALRADPLIVFRAKFPPQLIQINHSRKKRTVADQHAPLSIKNDPTRSRHQNAAVILALGSGGETLLLAQLAKAQPPHQRQHANGNDHIQQVKPRVDLRVIPFRGALMTAAGLQHGG